LLAELGTAVRQTITTATRRAPRGEIPRPNHREGRDITFTDPRGRNMGTAGVTGIWGTRPAPPVVNPRPLSMSAFRIEAARLIGAARADEIIRTISAPDFFGPISDACQRPNAFVSRVKR
jgi:hypothetical protein